MKNLLGLLICLIEGGFHYWVSLLGSQEVLDTQRWLLKEICVAMEEAGQETDSNFAKVQDPVRRFNAAMDKLREKLRVRRRP